MAGQSTFRRLWQPPGRYEDRATDRRVTFLELYRTAEIALPVCALLCLAVGLTDWGAEGSLSVMVVLLLAPVAAGTAVWLKHTEPDTLDLGWAHPLRRRAFGRCG